MLIGVCTFREDVDHGGGVPYKCTYIDVLPPMIHLVKKKHGIYSVFGHQHQHTMVIQLLKISKHVDRGGVAYLSDLKDR